ncbi:MAG: hypothetical protein IAE83_03900 [Anaerolinea sp.]|nr:hypothetical protein [Anaerolinea sp.]
MDGEYGFEGVIRIFRLDNKGSDGCGCQVMLLIGLVLIAVLCQQTLTSKFYAQHQFQITEVLKANLLPYILLTFSGGFALKILGFVFLPSLLAQLLAFIGTGVGAFWSYQIGYKIVFMAIGHVSGVIAGIIGAFVGGALTAVLLINATAGLPHRRHYSSKNAGCGGVIIYLVFAMLALAAYWFWR